MSQVNLKQLAKELKLSISTVSRALSDSYEISLATKQKVLSLAKKLNYQPNPYARSLRKRNSNTLAIIIPEIENNFFALAIKGIDEVAQRNGYHVLIYITHENIDNEIAYINDLLNGRVDGVIMSLSGGNGDVSHIHALIQNKTPVVFFDRVGEEVATAKVTTNDLDSAYLATYHLIEKGCKRICYLGHNQSHSIEINRRNGYLSALSKNRISFNEEYILSCPIDSEDTIVQLKKLLTSSNRPDGIFASVEQLALMAYEACNDLGLRIPEDIKVISFSNSKMAALLHPPLTSIVQPAFDIGKQTAEMLFKGLRARAGLENETIVIPSTLIERRSTS